MISEKHIVTFRLLIISFILCLCSSSCTTFNLLRFQTNSMTEMEWISIGESAKPLDMWYPGWDDSRVIAEWSREEIRKKIDGQLEGQKFPNGKLLFIKSEITDKIVDPRQYKLMLVFSFAVHNKYDLNPNQLFNVYQNNTDISNDVRYGTYEVDHWNYRIFQGIYSPSGYLDNTKEHTFIIKLRNPSGPAFSNKLRFKLAGKSANLEKYPRMDSVFRFGTSELIDNSTIPLGKTIKAFDINKNPMGSHRGYGSPITEILEDSYSKDIYSRVDEVMEGVSVFPNDIMIFFNAQCNVEKQSNPPRLKFSFLIPDGDLTPTELVTLKLDNVDVTDKFAFNQRRNRYTGTNVCIGWLNDLRFFDPNVEHTFEILIKTFSGRKFVRKIEFRVPRPIEIHLQGGIGCSDDGRSAKPILNEVHVELFFKSEAHISLMVPGSTAQRIPHTPYLDIPGESFLDPGSWILEYENGTPAPEISRIELVPDNFSSISCKYVIYLKDDLSFSNRPFFVRIETSDGFVSDKLQVL